MARVQCFVASAKAYSATTVLPADVCAATKTHSLRSSRYIASFWKVSSSNGNACAGSGTSRRSASSTSCRRSITAHSSSFFLLKAASLSPVVWFLARRVGSTDLRSASSSASGPSVAVLASLSASTSLSSPDSLSTSTSLGVSASSGVIRSADINRSS